jgi:hypothetical protein
MGVLVPLTAYDVVQDFTYTPNDTTKSQTLPFSNLVPASLRRNPGDFTGHTFNTGDSFKTTNLIFRYTVGKVLPPSTDPDASSGKIVSDFIFRNYGLANTCDVYQISIVVAPQSDIGDSEFFGFLHGRIPLQINTLYIHPCLG